MDSSLRDGAIVLDKPPGWTSHDAVSKLRRLAKTRRIGHLGTLDPSATGVLPLLVGRVTRLARFYSGSDKVYDGVLRFGFATDTYDADGEPAGPLTDPVIDRAALEAALAAFRGTFLQTPPPVSAKKVGGVPAYKLARKHVAVELKPVEVTVNELELTELDGFRARIRVRCGGGTYVRSIAHDLGAKLGCGAHLAWLRRLRTGGFSIEQAFTIAALEELARENRLAEALIPAAQLLPEFPAERVDPATAGFIRLGRDFRVSPFRVPSGSRYVRAIDTDGDLLAIGEAVLPNLYHPTIVL